jgi:TPR repeat protein
MGLERLKKQASGGDPEAQFRLGVVYSEGSVCRRNRKRAMELYMASARGAIASGAYNVGFYHEYGLVGEKDDRAAMRWYRKAADAGHIDAMVRLGNLLTRRGGRANLARAYSFYKKAMGFGHAGAIFNVAMCLSRGCGVQRNLRSLRKAHALLLYLTSDRKKKRELSETLFGNYDPPLHTFKRQEHKRLPLGRRTAGKWDRKTGGSENGSEIK